MQRLNAVKKIVGPRAHVVQARGSEVQNDEFCRKDGVIAVELETMNASIGEKGCKAQTGDVIHKLIQQRLDGVTPIQIAAGDDVVLYFRYQKQIEKTVADYQQAQNVAELKATYESTTWRVWQLRLIEELQKPADPRKVIWYVDDVGNSGKTFLTKYLLTEGKCMRYENGKSADVKFAYNGQEIIVFDLSRSQETHVNYEVIESIKNGVVFSTKYVSEMKVFKTPHVVIMANFGPDQSKMSQDRWDIRWLTDADNLPPTLDEVMDVYL